MVIRVSLWVFWSQGNLNKAFSKNVCSIEGQRTMGGAKASSERYQAKHGVSAIDWGICRLVILVSLSPTMWSGQDRVGASKGLPKLGCSGRLRMWTSARRSALRERSRIVHLELKLAACDKFNKR